MNRIKTNAFAALAILATSACQIGPQPLSDADMDAIHALSQEFRDALLAGDATRTSMLYTEDAVLLPPNERPVRGRAAIAAWAGGFPPLLEFTVTSRGIDGTGDMAYAHGSYTMKLDMEGTPVDSGSYLDIRVRQADGSWKFVADMFNSDLPAAVP